MEPGDLANLAADATDPLTALRAVASLRSLAALLESRPVEEAIRAGRTWAEIAAALGVTRQAVHKKYAKRLPASLSPRSIR